MKLILPKPNDESGSEIKTDEYAMCFLCLILMTLRGGCFIVEFSPSKIVVRI